MIVKLISYPENFEEIAKLSASICYSPHDNYEGLVQEAKNKDITYLEKIIKSGHLSILEHNVFVFYVANVSRALSHQLVRKRIASFSQQSQRYVEQQKREAVVPPTIQKDEVALLNYKSSLRNTHALYMDFLSSGVSKEDARYILPNATPTQLIVSMNAHALFDFFSRRCCRRAQAEIRELANRMLALVRKVSDIFQMAGAFCEQHGYCPEEKSCGKAPTLKQLKEKYYETSRKVTCPQL